MRTPAEKNKSRHRWWALALALPGLAVCIYALVLHVQVLKNINDLQRPDPEIRAEALRHLADAQASRAAEAVGMLLADEQNRMVLDWAGYAAVKVGAGQALPVMRQRVDQGPDDTVRANLIIYTVRLSGRDPALHDWLIAGLAGDEPWRQVGSAVGLLKSGDPQGGIALMNIICNKETTTLVREFAYKELYKVAGPVGETIGRPLDDWPFPAIEVTDPERWQPARARWIELVDRRLLTDVLDRLQSPGIQWIELDRLMHARNRIAKLF